jgi:hypothetical protein
VTMQSEEECYWRHVSPARPPPTCLLCGMMIVTLPQSPRIESSTPRVFFREMQWNHHNKTTLSHVMVPSSEVEEASFSKYPGLWACTSRASNFHCKSAPESNSY